MFTGIIEELGTIKQIKNGQASIKLVVGCSRVLAGSKLGDSIAVNGVCLTVTSMTADTFTADVMPETMRRTGFSQLSIGSKVNLERAMLAGGRFGGHIVSGHIDGIGYVASLKKEDNAVWVSIDTSKDILKYIVEKGSVSIDGISLTVAYVDSSCFKVSIIPHTAGHTTLLDKKPKDIVNLECDVVGKYIEKLVMTPKEEPTEESSGITMEFLSKYGF